MTQLVLSFFGQPRLVQNNQPIAIKSRKGLALLAYLAASGPSAPRDVLATLLWPEYDQTRARANLRRVLFTLNQTPVGTWLVADPDTVILRPETDDQIDVVKFEGRLTKGGIEDLSQAVALYRGDFLCSLSLPDSQPFEEWATLQRENYRRQVLEALDTLIHDQLAHAEYAAAEASARRQLEIDDLRESAWRGLMEALARDGRRNAALAVYERYARLLQNELDAPPAAETAALCEEIRAGALDAGEPSISTTATTSTLRGYELQEQIGAGSLGQVYRAYQAAVERQVAIKIIVPRYANQPDFIRRFEAEAQLVAQLEHPHIVPLYDYWRDPNGAYLVMRLMKGGSLKDALKQGPFDLEATIRLLSQVGSALAVAHQRKVIHRDIKPANILLDGEGNAYLSDFWIGNDLQGTDGAPSRGAIVGTPGYIAPEQVRSEPASPQMDIYSLGVVLYELLAGQHPFPDTPSALRLVKQYNEPLPSVQEARPDLSAALDVVVQQATAREADDRYPDVQTMITDLNQALNGTVPVRRAWAPPPQLPLLNPFKGLRAFLEADADDFFGREALTQRLLAKLDSQNDGDGPLTTPVPPAPKVDTSRFLAIVGPSGSGKSSVVRAGLVPALRKGALPGSEDWFVVQMLPGAYPLEELEIGLLRIASRPARGLMEQLRRDARGILRAARLVLPDDGQLLLIIDQFEELFTLVDTPSVRQHFMDSLYAAVTDPRSPVRVVVTLRADFYDRPLMHPGFSNLVQERTEVVVPLTVEELERAIRAPVERVGAKLETGLVTTVVADVHEQPGALPLLQYALTELFERRNGRMLTCAAYQEIGGVLGALGRRAEEVYQELDQDGQAAACQLFLRLVTLGEGTEDTRRRALRTELEALSVNEGLPSSNGSGSLSSMQHIIDLFGRARLLSFDRDPVTRGPTVEVAHEALMREWRRLREWLDNSRSDVRMQRVLANTAAEWLAAGRDPSFLLRGSRLDQFEGWATETELALTQDERDLIDASNQERQRREEARRAQQERELALERALVRRLRIITGVLLTASVLGILLTLALFRQSQRAQNETRSRATQQAVAESERTRAETQARLAAARELAAAAASNLEVDPQRSILLALRAVNTTYAIDGTVLPQAEAVLHQAVLASHLQLSLTRAEWGPVRVYDVAFSPDGTRLVTGVGNNTAVVWDASTGQVSRTLSHPKQGNASLLEDGVQGVAYSPDGSRLATAGADGEVKIWDTTSGRVLGTLGRLSLLDFVYRVDFSPDGKRLATVSSDGTPRVWEVDSGQELFPLTGYDETVWDVAFSPDGAYLATGDDTTAQLWDAASGQKLLTLPGHSAPVWGIAYNPDGTRLATASADGTAKVWDISTLSQDQNEDPEQGRLILSLTGHADQVMDVAFSPDGARLATGSADGTAKVWELSTGKEFLSLTGHTDLISALVFSPDGTRLATAGADGTARVWDLTPDQELLSFYSGTVYDMALNPDGTRLATTSARGTATVWDLTTGEAVLTVSDKGYTQPLDKVEFREGADRLAPGVAFGPACASPPGTEEEHCAARLATAGTRQTAKIWDAVNGQRLLTLSPAGFVNGIAFSPDGRLLATTAEDPVTRIWDVTTGEKLLELGFLHRGPVKYVAFSPDGTLLATAGTDCTAVIWDTATGWFRSRLSGHSSALTSVAFSPDGKFLATASRDTTVKIWDVLSGEERLTLAGHNAAVNSVAYSPECASPTEGGPERCGARLATASTDGTTRVWDARTGEELRTISTHPVGVGRVAFSHDGTRLITANWDHTVRVYSLSIDELIALARSRLTRALTEEECQQYLHVETCPE